MWLKIFTTDFYYVLKLSSNLLKLSFRCLQFNTFGQLNSVQFSSVAQSCPTVCDPMNRSTPGLPVHHQLPEFTQTHIHQVSDAIEPSHPLSPPSSPAPNPSQQQILFQLKKTKSTQSLIYIHVHFFTRWGFAVSQWDCPPVQGI